MAPFPKYLFIGLISIGIAITASAVLAVTNLDTAYIQPRTTVYIGGNFRVLADNKFDRFQQALIGPASKILHERLNRNRSKILDCAYKRSNEDLPSSRGAIDEQLRTVFVNAASGNRPIKMTVAWMGGEPGAVGKAPVGNPGQYPQKGDLLRVALNSDYFGAQATYYLKNNFDYWVITGQMFWHMKFFTI